MIQNQLPESLENYISQQIEKREDLYHSLSYLYSRFHLGQDLEIKNWLEDNQNFNLLVNYYNEKSIKKDSITTITVKYNEYKTYLDVDFTGNDKLESEFYDYLEDFVENQIENQKHEAISKIKNAQRLQPLNQLHLMALNDDLNATFFFESKLKEKLRRKIIKVKEEIIENNEILEINKTILEHLSYESTKKQMTINIAHEIKNSWLQNHGYELIKEETVSFTYNDNTVTETWIKTKE